jgi:hypothetical protein
LIEAITFYHKGSKCGKIFDRSHVIPKVGLPIPKNRIPLEKRLVGTLLKALHHKFGEFVGDFAIFESFQISDCGKKIPIHFFVGMSHRKVRDYNFSKPFFLD